MKAYNKYMDEVTVSNTLHENIMSRIEAAPKPWPAMIRRYAAAFACLAVVFLGIFAVSKLAQHNASLIPSGTPWALQPDSSTPTPGVSEEYSLHFNNAASQSSHSISIPGHFWRELTDEELMAVFPGLMETHDVTATANFQSDANEASLFNVDAYAVSSAGLKTYIQLALGEVVLDYRFDVETKASDVFGTAVTAGYFETKPNSKGLKGVAYFATFRLSDVAYYVELGGAETDKEELRNEISRLIGLLIQGGVADFEVCHL